MVKPPFDYGEYAAGRGVNYWRHDPVLRREARRAYPEAEFAWAEERLDEFGELVGTTVADNADVVDDNGPELRTYDKFGAVQNVVDYHPAQLENDRLAYERGIVADAFRPPPDRDEPVGLLHTLTMQVLLSYADAGFVCPVSMTAGAALVLRNHDDGALGEYFRRLTSRDYDDHAEGAMFLTEEQGGSDVGANETVAEPVEEARAGGGGPGDGSDGGAGGDTGDGGDAGDDGGDADALAARTYELTGEKWFCSNIDADGTLVLARRVGAPAGTEGLSLFLVPNTTRDGEVNHQRYRRLKDKLGTVSVPTGEVELNGAEGYLVGEPERGFRYMTTMLNWERVTNATGAVGIMGRALLESKVRAANREAFGQPIQSFPLMKRDLVEMAVDYEAALTFTMETAEWLDRYERDHDDREAFRLMRTFTPIAKLRTARMAVDTASYAMEIQGGNGYVEDFVTHRLLRDAQVLPIWEGTSNVLSLDLLRTLEREDVLELLVPYVEDHLGAVDHPFLDSLATAVADEFQSLQAGMATLAAGDVDYAQHEAKELANYLFDVVTASLLLSRAQAEIDEFEDGRKALVAAWFVRESLQQRSGRGIGDGAALPLAGFDAVVRHATFDPDSLADVDA